MATWSEAFSAQAKSDRKAYYLLTESALPASHSLHYLQMWLEKLCKAYVLETHAEAFRRKHDVVASKLPAMIREHWRHIGFQHLPNMREIRELCREIDLLHPKGEDNQPRPDNAEYPWIGASGRVEVPAQWKFPLARRLYSNVGRLLIKAADRLTENPAVFIRRG